MGREIKFRAWNKNKEQMLEVAEITWKSGKAEPIAFFSPEDNVESVIPMEKYEYELMQYTGLKDKNDQKIYEGDILEYWNESWSEQNHIGIVKFNRGCFHLELKTESDFFGEDETIHITPDSTYEHAEQTVKIIGNKFENPDLLTNQK